MNKNLTLQINRVNQWIQRRLDKGIRINADAIMAYINKSWPNLNSFEKDYIYQNTK